MLVHTVLYDAIAALRAAVCFCQKYVEVDAFHQSQIQAAKHQVPVFRWFYRCARLFPTYKIQYQKIDGSNILPLVDLNHQLNMFYFYLLLLFPYISNIS